MIAHINTGRITSLNFFTVTVDDLVIMLKRSLKTNGIHTSYNRRGEDFEFVFERDDISFRMNVSKDQLMNERSTKAFVSDVLTAFKSR